MTAKPALSSSTLQSSFLRLQRAFTPTHGRRKTKHESTTMCINHWADSAGFKSITFNQLCSGLTGKCFEMPNASYTNR